MERAKKIRGLDGKVRTLSPSGLKWLNPGLDPEGGFATQLGKQMRREHGLPTDGISEELLIRLLGGIDHFARKRGLADITRRPAFFPEERRHKSYHVVNVDSSTEVILRSLREGLRFLLIMKDTTSRESLLKVFASPIDREFLWYGLEDTDEEKPLSAKSDREILWQTYVTVKNGNVGSVMFKTKRLSCHVRALWIPEQLGARRLRVRLYFTLDFTHWAPISLNYRALPDRGKMPRSIKKEFFPYHGKRVYIPEGNGQYQSEEVWVSDAFAVICLYLLQERFVDLDIDEEVRAFLFQYLRGFRGAYEVGILNLLEHLRQHYRLSEDYRAWRKYVSMTIRGLIATQRKQLKSSFVDPSVGDGQKILDPQSNQEFWLVSGAASQVGISERWLYKLIEQKEVQIKYIPCGTRRLLAIEPSQLDELRDRLKKKQKRQKIIEYLARHKGIHKDSVRRWLKRTGEYDHVVNIFSDRNLSIS